MQGTPSQKQLEAAPKYREYERLKKSLCDWLKRLGYAESTIKRYKKQLVAFFEWLTSQQIDKLEEVNKTDLESFRTHLETRRNKNSKSGGLSESYIYGHFTVIKLLNQYLQLTSNQTVLNGRIRLGKRKTSEIEILEREEVTKLYEVTENDIIGYRDRALLSLYYGCGLRISEGVNLDLKDVHYEKDLVYVKASKNDRSRYVPLNAEVRKDLESYAYYRSIYLQTENSPTTFLLGDRGLRISKNSVTKRLKIIGEKAGIQKRMYAHLLRHSIATHLLQAGMELESISQFLGHNSLEATEIYTHLTSEV